MVGRFQLLLGVLRGGGDGRIGELELRESGSVGTALKEWVVC